MWRPFFMLALFPAVAFGQAFTEHKSTTLDALIDEWNGITQKEESGVSILQPQKIEFVATLQSMPTPCSNATLGIVSQMIGAPDLLVNVTHCLRLTSSKGRNVIAYVQDVLVPGLNSDAKIGGSVEVYADFLAYGVETDRSRNYPILLISRFEPR
jgi:hypothetical protein